MQGLLDDPARVGLLATGLGLMGARGRLGPALGNAGLTGLGMFQQAMQDAQRRKLQELQMQSVQQNLAAQQAERERRAQLEKLPQQFTTPEGMNYQGLSHAYAGMGEMDRARDALSMLPKRPTVKDYKEVRQPNGTVSIVGLDEYGTPINTGMTPWKAPEVRDFGGYVGSIDPLTSQVRNLGTKTMTEAERNTSARGWASLGADKERLALDKERFAFEKTKPTDTNKAPPGYRWKPDGSMEAVPGGPADVRAGAAKERAISAAQNAAVKADIVLSKVDDALGKTGWSTTGATGAVLGRVPGTTAYDLGAVIETIKANIGFQELAAMREASPTGGALGQVAVQELNSLQATIANLDKNQSRAQVEKSLKDVRKHFTAWRNAMQKAAGQTGGSTGEWDFNSLPDQDGAIDFMKLP